MSDGPLSFEIEREDGTRIQYTIRPVILREAITVQNTVKDIVAPLIGEVSVTIQSAVKRGTVPVEALQRIASVVDLTKLWDVGALLFRGSVIRTLGTEPIYNDLCVVDVPSFDDPAAGYFVTNTAEWIAATLKAVSINWPGFFLDLRATPKILFRSIIPTSADKRE